MHGNHAGRIGKTEAVQSVFQVSFGVVNVNRAPTLLRTRGRLGDEEQLVHRIKFDVGPAEDLTLTRTRQYHSETGLGFEIVEFHAGVVFRGGAENTIGRIDGNPIDEAKSDARELAERALHRINHSDDGEALKASIPSTQHGLVCQAVKRDRRGHAGEVFGVSDLDHRTERIGGDIGAEYIRDEVPAIVVGKHRDVETPWLRLTPVGMMRCFDPIGGVQTPVSLFESRGFMV